MTHLDTVRQNMTSKIWIITIFPPQNTLHWSGASWVWSYTKNLINNLPPTTQKNIVVLCDYDNKNKKSDHLEWLYQVSRCWTREWVIWSIWQILSSIKKNTSIKTVHIQHEFNMFWGVWTIPLVLFLLACLKIKKIKTIITFHWLSSPDIINKKYCKINLLPRYLPAIFIKFAFLTFYWVAKLLIDHVVVHEEYFSTVLRLKYWYDKKSISVIHHGIELIDPTTTKDIARKKLSLPNKKIILYFGFVAWYKWLELLLDWFEQLDSEYHLIIAWWIPKRTQTDPIFISRYNQLEKRIQEMKNVTRIWFVPDEDIENLFIASDLLIIPYLYMLAASGPMSLAIAYWLPFLVSEVFKSVISCNEMIFELKSIKLAQLIQNCEWEQLDKIRLYISSLKEERQREKIGSKTFQLYQTYEN